MLRILLLTIAGGGFLILMPANIQASLLFEANLEGVQEVPANASPATGYGTVLLNDAENQITVNFSWSGLTASPTAAHIHGPASPGFNASPIFTLAGITGTSGAIPEQVFAITPSQVADLKEGLHYLNIHTSLYPGGEIRGQLMLVPEPATLSAMILGGLLLLHKRRR